MVDDYFERPAAVARCRSGCTGPYVDALAAALSTEGYTRNAGRLLLRGVVKLGGWLEACDVPLARLDEALVVRFVHDQMNRPGGGRSSSLRRQYWASGRRLLAWGREHGIVSTFAPHQPVPEIVCGFEAWMRSHRGSSEKTLQHCYRLPLRRFVDAMGHDPSRFDARGIRTFVLAESRRAGASYTKTVVTAVRMLLRYLAILGRCSADLVDAVPKVAQWRLGGLPAALSRDNVDRLIKACDCETVGGRRDRAMLLLMTRLALRAGDVSGLRLDDIDWTDATIQVSGKSRRLVRMPLPQEVGDAVLLCLSDRRHGADTDHVFLRLCAPFGPLDPTGVSSVVRRAARRADVDLPRAGSHVLRHTAATALLRDEMSLPGIAAVLRHQKLNTTMLYAKVDTALLTSVARPWPVEVSP